MCGLRFAIVVVVGPEGARLAAATQALDAQHLLVRLATNGERDEVIAGRDERALGAASESATTAPTPAALTRWTQQPLQLLGAARERVECLGGILLACRGALTATAATCSANDRTFTGTWIPRAASSTTAAATAAEQRGHVTAGHRLA